jgi:two-component system phosphate regulon response regulator PhoB
MTDTAQAPHLLVVEDEQDMRSLLEHQLTREGYRVTAVERGEAGLTQAQKDAPDLIILDLMLPGMDGLEFCRSLKRSEETAAIPIIMLTARTEDADVVTGLELGADDYVTKPFSPRVLLARVRAVMRRQAREASETEDGEGEDILDRGPLVINRARHRVHVEHEKVDLTATEFEVLHLIARHPGRVFTRQQIIEDIHGPMTAVTERSVDVLIVGLRRKLGSAGRFIETVRGVGYRFEP